MFTKSVGTKKKHRLLLAAVVLFAINGSVLSGCNRHFNKTARKPIKQLTQSEISRYIGIIEVKDKTNKIIAQGNGFFAFEKGFFCTSWHILAGGNSAIIISKDGKCHTVKGVVLKDEIDDYAVLKINGEEPKLATLGEPEKVHIGDKTFIASMENDSNSPSLLNENIKHVSNLSLASPFFLYDKIPPDRTDGAPLLDSKGKIIGLTSHVECASKKVSFAISIDLIAKKLNSLTSTEIMQLPPFLTMTISKQLRNNYYRLGLITFSYATVDWQKVDKKQVKIAKDFFVKAIEVDSKFALAYLFKGFCLDALSQYDDAITEYKSTIKLESDNAGAYYGLGRAYDNLKLSDKALVAYQEAIRIKPEFAQVYNAIGIVYSKKESYEKAVEAYNKAIQIKPDYAWCYANLGLAYEALGQYDKSDEAYKEAIHLDQKYVNAYRCWGYSYLDRGLYEESINPLEEAVRIEPDDAELQYNLGYAYSKTERYKDAIKAFKKAIESNTNFAEAYVNLGNAYGNLGEDEKALESFQKGASLNQNLVNAYSGVGCAYQHLGKYKEAITAYKKAIKLKPDDAFSYYGMAYCYQKLGDQEKAREYNEKATDLGFVK